MIAIKDDCDVINSSINNKEEFQILWKPRYISKTWKELDMKDEFYNFDLLYPPNNIQTKSNFSIINEPTELDLQRI
jgi:hypothetical protein